MEGNITMAKYYQQVKNRSRFYMKRKRDVLHVNTEGSLLNVLDDNFLEYFNEPLNEICKDEFLKAYNQVIDKVMI
jgi:hypothetical protein